MKLRKIEIMSKSGNVCSIELYEETSNENYYEIIDNTLDDNIVYNEINYDELNVETTDENLIPNAVYDGFGNGIEISTNRIE
jgi:hypothetical protein